MFGRSQGHRVKAARAGAAELLRPHETAGLQDLHVLHDRGERHGQRPAELADRGRPLAEPLQHEPSPGIGERVEDAVQVRRIVKHMLEYSRPRPNSQVFA